MMRCAIALSIFLAASVALAGENTPEAEVEKAAKQVIADFFEAFNAADNERLRTYSNYPHMFILADGRTSVAESPADLTMPFDAMRKNEGWHHSSLDKVEVTNVSEAKVHAEVVYSRYREDGTRYLQAGAMWILTKVDGHWGIQYRSLMPANFSLGSDGPA